MKLRRSSLTPKIFAFLGFFLCLVMTSTMDFTQAQLITQPQSAELSELKNFLKHQKLDLKIFTHLQKSEFSGFKALQDVELKEWESKEKRERHEFFKNHIVGNERRTYIQDFMKRRGDLLHKIAVEKAEKVKEQSSKLKLFQEEQDKKAKEFPEKLKADREAKVRTVEELPQVNRGN